MTKKYNNVFPSWRGKIIDFWLFDFSQGRKKVLWKYFILISYQYKMTFYNSVYMKNWNQEEKIKNGTAVILNLSSNEIGNSNDETNFPHKSLLTEKKLQGFVKFLRIINQLI